MADELCINTIRTLAADIVQKAKSGHPGAPMGMAPVAHVLWNKHLRFNPANPKWANRDRFVLSNGHASALLYTLLHLTGFKAWTIDVLKTFRQIGSPAAGHPENHFEGIEVTTGPLGQGISNAVGLAMAEAHFAARFNKPDFKVIDHYTYVFCGDGCLQEGISSEASSLAGHLGLGKLIVIYDDNHITIDGETELSFSEDVLKRYEAYGWHVDHVEHGNNDLSALDAAISRAKTVHDKPSFIKVTTVIGFGSAKQGTEGVHGSPLGDEDVANVKKKFHFDPTKFFFVPDEVRPVFDKTAKGAALEAEWNALFAKYAVAHPDLAAELKRRINNELPEGWDKGFPTFKVEEAAAATRTTSGKILNHFAAKIPDLIGGSADLNPSCFTYLKSDKDFLEGHYDQRNIRFGVREHGMSAICNGLAAYGGIIPFCSTFLNFIGYAYGAVVLSALSHLGVLYVFTHDSVFLGEDGPTHQPIEKYALCRATPNLHFWRPADGNETSAAYVSAIRSRHTPTVMSLTRQNVPNLAGSSVEKALKGGYILADCEGAPELVLVATGSETELVAKAQDKVGVKVRVVSLPCWEIFDTQPLDYRLSVFPDGVPVMSVEAAATSGWERYAHASVGIDRFGASAPGAAIAKEFGMNVDNVVAKAKQVAEYYKGKSVASRLLRPF